MSTNPLSKADIKACQSNIYEARLAQQEAERCKACGLDTAEAELRCESLLRFYQKVLENYGTLPSPSQPT